MSSMSIIKNGKGTDWRIKLSNKLIEDGCIYQQEHPNQEMVVHSCKNCGEPFDSSSHKAAGLAWKAVESLKRKPATKKEELEFIESFNIVCRMKEMRRRLDITTSNVGEAIGVSGRTVEDWEQGRYTPSKPAIMLLATWLEKQGDK